MGKVDRYHHQPERVVLSQCRTSLAPQKCLCVASVLFLLHQAADSDDDNDPVQFMGLTGEFNLTAHPEVPDAELNSLVDITTYGELNLIAEPQKVKICVLTE